MTRSIPAVLARLFEKSPQRTSPEPSLPAKRTHRLYGLEIFPGVGTPLSWTNRYGATFAAAETGRVSTAMIGWVNYTPIFFKPNTTCSVVGGRWLLLSHGRFRRPEILYGAFTGGEVRWNRDAKIALASLRLESSSGGKVTGNLTAALNHLPFPPFPPRIGGVLDLEYGPTRQ